MDTPTVNYITANIWMIFWWDLRIWVWYIYMICSFISVIRFTLYLYFCIKLAFYYIVNFSLIVIQVNFGWVLLCVVACIIIWKDCNVLQMVKLNFVFLTFMNINCRIKEKFSESIYLPDRLAWRRYSKDIIQCI